MADAANCTTFFTSNTDITGIGVRVAFYLQVNLLVLLVTVSPLDSLTAFWTLTSMTMGLMIAAMASASQDQLSFFNAIQVENLVWYANAAQLYVYEATGYTLGVVRKRDKLLELIFAISMWLSSALTLYLWAIAPTFRPYPECVPLTQFYFMFWKVHISFKSIRLIALVIYSLLSAYATFIVTIRRTVMRALEVAHKHVPPESPEQAERRQRTFFRNTLRNRMWEHAGWIVAQFSWIPPLELFIRQYPQPGGNSDSQWGFGQILAIISVIPSLVSVVFATVEILGSSRSRRSLERCPFSPHKTEDIAQVGQQVDLPLHLPFGDSFAHKTIANEAQDSIEVQITSANS